MPTPNPKDLKARLTQSQQPGLPQPVEPWYFSGKKFGYIVAFKPHDAYDWWYETISDPETRRYVHRDPYFVPTEEDFQVREFQVKIKSFNVKGDGPYSPTTVVYYPREGEPSRVRLRSGFCPSVKLLKCSLKKKKKKKVV